MSLVTITRQIPTDEDEEATDCVDSVFDTNKSEDYFASKATVILQNQIGRRRSSVIKEEDILQFNLKQIIELLRKEESLQLMVSIEKVNCKIDGNRYFCLISTKGKEDIDEYLILGVNVSKGRATIGYILPIYQDMSVKLDGDGGFKIKSTDGEKHFKPTSVHALWSTVQILNKACIIARNNNYYMGGLNHTWINYYMKSINSNRAQIAEWNRLLDADTVVNCNMAPKSAIGEYVIGTEKDERRCNEDSIRIYLEEIMRDEDMDNVTVTFLREKLQEKLSFDVLGYRRFIAEEILIIYGKMDVASNILPHLYLGSTYNASNLEELLENRISHILNVTRESENFFRDRFIYKNVEVFDLEETKLLKHFDPCYKFITDAKLKNGACLVHCQRGISRSASIVISYIMKECNLNLDDALKYVKERRDCIRPNDGFLQQLKTYEGILEASSHRYNSKFQYEKRNSLKSLPSDIYQDTMESPSYSDQVKDKHLSAGFAYTLQDSDSSMSENKIYKIKDDENQNETNINQNFICKDSACIQQSISTSDSNMLIDEQFCSTVTPCQLSSNENGTFSVDLNANSSSENIYSEKKQLIIKSDHSWIKPSNVFIVKNEDIKGNFRTKSLYNNAQDMQETLSDVGPPFKERHHSQMEMTDIDQQSLKPVKELVDKYKL